MDATTKFKHICEVCGKVEILTAAESFEEGWDYPPRMGEFGVVSPRTCNKCPIDRTVWWAIAIEHYTKDMLSPAQRDVVLRIAGEPGTILV
jgi:hypothetical protein